MHFSSQSSLANRAAVIVTASALYNVRSASKQEPCETNAYMTTWEGIANVAAEHLCSLAVPEYAKQYFRNLVQPMSRQIQIWLDLHDSFIPKHSLDLPNLLCWNPHGVIDKRKTAERILINNCTDEDNSFRIACIYCIETHIRKVWPKVCSYYEVGLRDGIRLSKEIEVLFWTSYLLQRIDTLMRFTEHTFSDVSEYGLALAIDYDNEVAAEYFLQKIDQGKRTKAVQAQFKRKLREETMTFTTRLCGLLLRYLPAEEHDKMLQKHPLSFLMRFMKWPEHHNFLQAADKMWDHMSVRVFYIILDLISRQHKKYCKGDVYKEIYKLFWIRSPSDFKKYVIRRCIDGPALDCIFKTNLPDDLIKLVLRNATPCEKEEMIISYNVMQALDYLVLKKRYSTIKTFIEGCILPENRLNDITTITAHYMLHILKNSELNDERRYFIDSLCLDLSIN